MQHVAVNQTFANRQAALLAALFLVMPGIASSLSLASNHPGFVNDSGSSRNLSPGEHSATRPTAMQLH
jgi:hypothetical protein